MYVDSAKMAQPRDPLPVRIATRAPERTCESTEQSHPERQRIPSQAEYSGLLCTARVVRIRIVIRCTSRHAMPRLSSSHASASRLGLARVLSAGLAASGRRGPLAGLCEYSIARSLVKSSGPPSWYQNQSFSTKSCQVVRTLLVCVSACVRMPPSPRISQLPTSQLPSHLAAFLPRVAATAIVRLDS